MEQLKRKKSKTTKQLWVHWCMQQLQLGLIYHSQSLLFADTILDLSLVIWPPPKEFFSISSLRPTTTCISEATIVSLDARTPIRPMIVLTTSLKAVTSSFPLVTVELSRGSLESKISSPCKPSKPNTSPAPPRYSRKRHLTATNQFQ